MRSPVRFMARGLAEEVGDEKPLRRASLRRRRRRRMRRQRREWRRRRRRLAPGAGVAARDHPVDEAGDDTRASHDFEMTPDDAIEAKRLRIEWNEPEITGQTHHAAA